MVVVCSGSRRHCIDQTFFIEKSSSAGSIIAKFIPYCTLPLKDFVSLNRFILEYEFDDEMNKLAPLNDRT